jgi:hypothetical protein
MDPPNPFARFPVYAVLFDGTVDEGPYPAFVTVPHVPDTHDTVPHGLDHEVVPALPGLWYCLHLPNGFHELIELPMPGAPGDGLLDLGHHILLAPIQAFDPEHLGPWADLEAPLLAVCPDALLDEAAERSEVLGFALPPAGYSTLSTESLRGHWREIAELLPFGEAYYGLAPEFTRRLDLAPTDLPRRWLTRQLAGEGGNRFETRASNEDDTAQERAIYAALDAQALAGALRSLEADDIGLDRARELLPAAIDQQRKSLLRVPVVAAIPGVAPGYIGRAYEKPLHGRVEPLSVTDARDTWTTAPQERSDALIERSTIELLTTHRAIARGGIGLMFPTLPREAFEILAQLESHMRAPRPKGRTVWRLLDRLASKTEHLWSEATVAAVGRASTLTVFSNFPVGLLRLPGDTSPLSGRVPITHRPLLPLTRALQTEFSYMPGIDLSKRVRVLVAECIPEDDPVGKLSRIGWEVTRAMLSRAGQVLELELAETLSPQELRAAVAERRPDLLIISAHGVVAPAGNVAGLAIGDAVVFGPGLGPLPPVVLLSACHVAPKGAGTIGIVDLLLREGALAVLGTQVPVDVRHNTLFMGRFLVNIAEVLAGRAPHGNLLEVWHRVQAGNAVNDVLAATKWLRKWRNARYGKDSAVIVEFMMSRSPGRLHGGDVYAETEAILGEIADDLGVGHRVRSSIRDPGYVPESLFYAFSGRPERIYLRSISEMLDLD